MLNYLKNNKKVLQDQLKFMLEKIIHKKLLILFYNYFKKNQKIDQIQKYYLK